MLFLTYFFVPLSVALAFPVNVALGAETKQSLRDTDMSAADRAVDGCVVMGQNNVRRRGYVDVAYVAVATAITFWLEVHLAKPFTVGCVLIYSSVPSKYVVECNV